MTVGNIIDIPIHLMLLTNETLKKLSRKIYRKFSNPANFHGEEKSEAWKKLSTKDTPMGIPQNTRYDINAGAANRKGLTTLVFIASTPYPGTVPRE